MLLAIELVAKNFILRKLSREGEAAEGKQGFGRVSTSFTCRKRIDGQSKKVASGHPSYSWIGALNMIEAMSLALMNSTSLAGSGSRIPQDQP